MSVTNMSKWKDNVLIGQVLRQLRALISNRRLPRVPMHVVSNQACLCDSGCGIRPNSSRKTFLHFAAQHHGILLRKILKQAVCGSDALVGRLHQDRPSPSGQHVETHHTITSALQKDLVACTFVRRLSR